MPTTAPNVGLIHSYALGENNWNVGMDPNLRALDLLAQARVIDKDLSTPPGSPADGDSYIVGGSPTGAWSGKATQLARYNTAGAAWEFYVPKEGWRSDVMDEDLQYRFNGSSWAVVLATGGYPGALGYGGF